MLLPRFDPAKLDLVCGALRAWYAARGGLPPGPTVNELATATGLPRSTVLRNLQRLVDLNRVTYVPGTERTWRLQPDSRAAENREHEAGC